MSGSVGTLALGIAGAVVGSFFGAPQIGFLVGSLAGSLLFGQAKQNGPRLNDTTVQGASYGTMVPIVYGTIRIGGIGMGQGSTANGPNKFTEEEESSGGKGGGGGASTYKYKLSYFNALCQGPIGGVMRRWEYGRLVTDTSGVSDDYPAVVYPGNSSQLPDPTMETIYGEGNVAPMRGVAYEAVTERDITENGGGGRPNTEYEVYTEGGTIPWRYSEFEPWGTPQHSNYYHCTAIYRGGVITTMDMANGTDTTFRIRKFRTNGEQIGGTIEAECTGSTAVFTVMNLLVAMRSVNTGEGTDYIWFGWNPSTEAVEEVSREISGSHVPDGPMLYKDGYIFGIQQSGLSYYLARWEAPDGLPAAGGGYVDNVLIGTFDGSITITMGDTNEDGAIYVMYPDSSVGSPDTILRKYSTDDLSVIHEWDGSDTGSTNLVVGGIGFYVYNGYIAGGRNLGGNQSIYLVKINDDLTLSDHSETILTLPGGNATQSIGLGGGLVLDPIGVYSLNPPGGSVILGDIVSDLLQRAGVPVEKIDMSDLDPEVRGFVVGSQMTVQNAISVLRQGFFFDVTEVDGVIVGRMRGHDASETIPDDDLCAHVPGTEKPEPLEWVRMPEAELPRTVYVNYYDYDHDYQRGSQYWRHETTTSENDVTLDLPIVFTASEALQRAQWHMHYARLERDTGVFFLTDEYCHLRPTDVVVVRGIAVRITSVTEMPDGILKFECVRAFAGPASPITEPPEGGGGEVPGAPPSGQPPATPPLPKVATRLVLLDIPRLLSSHAPYGFYAVMGPASNEGPWPGASLYKSIDGGNTWILIAQTTARGVIGKASGALADYTDPLEDLDETSTVEIVLTDEKVSLSSISTEGLDNGGNLSALKAGSDDDDWELLQFQTATLTAPKTYDLEDFYRGRKDTADKIAGHAADDTFVLLSTAINVDAPEEELNVPLLYKAVTYGQALADVLPIEFTNTGVGSTSGPGTGGSSLQVEDQDGVIDSAVDEMVFGGNAVAVVSLATGRVGVSINGRIIVYQDGVLVDTFTALDFLSPLAVNDAGGGICEVSGGSGAASAFGMIWSSGVDGSVVFDGVNAVTGASRSGTVYTLTRSVSYVNCTVDPGVTVKFGNAGGIWCTGTLTNNGTIEANGNNGSGASGGTAVTAAFWSGTGVGGAGSFGSGGGITNALGGRGGEGGIGTGGTAGLPVGGGGTRGGVTIPTATEGGLAYAAILQAGLSGRSTGATRYGGGGGGGGGTLNSGGGAGAGCGLVAARLIAGSGSYTANGGDGVNSAIANGGGGGGGGGGALWLFTTTANPASVWTIQVNGGVGGTATGTGRNGEDGDPGRMFVYTLA